MLPHGKKVLNSIPGAFVYPLCVSLWFPSGTMVTSDSGKMWIKSKLLIGGNCCPAIACCPVQGVLGWDWLQLPSILTWISGD